MSEDNELTIEERNEISRRESIKRGALAGAAIWSAPVIRAVNLGHGRAPTPPPKSPTGGGHDISYIAMNVTKHGKKFTYQVGSRRQLLGFGPGFVPVLQWHLLSQRLQDQWVVPGLRRQSAKLFDGLYHHHRPERRRRDQFGQQGRAGLLRRAHGHRQPRFLPLLVR